MWTGGQRTSPGRVVSVSRGWGRGGWRCGRALGGVWMACGRARGRGEGEARGRGEGRRGEGALRWLWAGVERLSNKLQVMIPKTATGPADDRIMR